MSNGFPHIVCTPHTLSGSPRIDGRRLAVGDVVSFVKNYGTLQQVLEDYELTLDQVSQALGYCATLQCKADNPLVFCHNCSLDAVRTGLLDTTDLEEVASEDTVSVRGREFIFFGSMQELQDEWSGCNWWVVATDLLLDLRNELFGGTTRS